MANKTCNLKNYEKITWENLVLRPKILKILHFKIFLTGLMENSNKINMSMIKSFGHHQNFFIKKHL